MDIIVYKGRPVDLLLIDEFAYCIICTKTLVGDHLVLKWTLFSETSRSNRTMTAILNRLMLSGQAEGY